MLNTAFRQYLLCLFLGIVIAFVATFVIGYTSAIAAPQLWFTWFGSTEVGLFLWDTIVVYGLGVGVPAVLALFIAFRFTIKPTMYSGITFVIGVLLAAYVLLPLVYDTPLSLAYTRPWWGYGFEVSLICAVLAALLLTRCLWFNKPRQPLAP